MAREQLDIAAVAQLLGVTPETIMRYRVADRAAKYPFPQEDGKIGRTPWWWRETIEEWRKNRPGAGAGAGRPRKNPGDGTQGSE